MDRHPSWSRSASPVEDFKLSRLLAAWLPSCPRNLGPAWGPYRSFEEPLWNEPWGCEQARNFSRPGGGKEEWQDWVPCCAFESRKVLGGGQSYGKVHRNKREALGRNCLSEEAQGRNKMKSQGRKKGWGRDRENKRQREIRRPERQEGKGHRAATVGGFFWVLPVPGKAGRLQLSYEGLLVLQKERHRFLGANSEQANLPPVPFCSLLSLWAASFPRENSYLRSWVCLHNMVQVTPQHGHSSPIKSRRLHWLGVSMGCMCKRRDREGSLRYVFYSYHLDEDSY